MSYEKAAVIAAVNKVAAGLAAKVIAELDAPKFKEGAIYVNKVYREGHNHPFIVGGGSLMRSDGRVVAIAGMKEKFEDFVEVTSFCSLRRAYVIEGSGDAADGHRSPTECSCQRHCRRHHRLRGEIRSV